jgi:group I intron endonuclease
MSPIDKRLSHIPFGVCGVYKLTAPNGKIYIGQSLNLRKRLNTHKTASKNNPTMSISNAIRKYGFDNFKVEALMYFKPHKDSTFNIGLLDAIEIACVEKYKSLDKKIGYNIKPAGNNKQHSEETKEKLRQKAIGRKASPETKAKISDAMKKRDPEVHKRASEKRKGRILSQEYIDKVVEGNLYRYKAVDQYTQEGVYVQSFRSAEKAAQSVGVGSWKILSAARKFKGCSGYVWRFKGESFERPVLAKIRINQYDKDMNLIGSFKNKAEIGRVLNFDPSFISKATTGKREFSYGFIWKEELCPQ